MCRFSAAVLRIKQDFTPTQLTGTKSKYTGVSSMFSIKARGNLPFFLSFCNFCRHNFILPSSPERSLWESDVFALSVKAKALEAGSAPSPALRRLVSEDLSSPALHQLKFSLLRIAVQHLSCCLCPWLAFHLDLVWWCWPLSFLASWMHQLLADRNIQNSKCKFSYLELSLCCVATLLETSLGEQDICWAYQRSGLWF